MKSASTSAMGEVQTAVVNPVVARRRGRPATGQKGRRKLNAPSLQRSQSDIGYPRPAIPTSSIATKQLPSIRTTNMNSLMEEDEDENKMHDEQQGQFKELDIVDGLSSDIEPHGHVVRHELVQEGANDTNTSQKLIHGTMSSSQSSPSLPTSPSELSEANPFDQRFGSAGTSPIMSAIPRYSIQSRPQSTDIHDKVNEYLSKLVDYFISSEVRSNRSVPTELLLPPPHSAPYIDAPIDPELHTAFHWSCSMGNLPIVEALVEAGTSLRSTNSQGQTPLMRSSMFHNSYSRRTFPRIFELLHDTVFEVDSQLQTVIHHVVKRKSSTPSAVYYLDVILSKIKDFSPQYRIELLLNAQDRFGDTALHIAAENGDKTFFNTLVRNGALSTITNKERLTPNEIMNEHYEHLLTKNHAQVSSDMNLSTNGNSGGTVAGGTGGSGGTGGTAVTGGGMGTASAGISGIGGLSGRMDSPMGSMTPLLNTAASDYMMFPSQAATRLSRCIPEVVASMKQMAERFNTLYHQRDTDTRNMERTLHSMSKTIRSVNLRTMAVLNTNSVDEFDSTMEHKLAETERLRREVKSLRTQAKSKWEREQYLLLKHYLESSENAGAANHQPPGALDERLKLAFELCVLQLQRKSKLESALQVVEDNSKIHKYRKMISEGTEMDTEKVDGCLDVILESLSNK